MWIKTTRDKIMESEPHLGYIEESELMEDDGEGLDLLMEYMEDQQECPTTFIAIDYYTDEDIVLQTSEYLTSEQIDRFNEAFIVTDEWTQAQLEFINV